MLLADCLDKLLRGTATMKELVAKWPNEAQQLRAAIGELRDAGLIDLDPVAATSSAPPSDTTSLAALGRYRIVRELGRGGMGVVYLALDPQLERPVAIKILPPALAMNPLALARFEHEARFLAALNHPNIATIHSSEEADGQRFLTMEYVDGETLADELERGPLGVERTLELGRQIARALEAAHQRAIVHRDLKPQNICLASAGYLKVLDFGLAKAMAASDESAIAAAPARIETSAADSIASASRRSTKSGEMLGTPGYMSPEQVRGGTVDHRTDIWALGCILYECLTGKYAFPGGTALERFTATLAGSPDWNALPATMPVRLRQLLTSLLTVDPTQRLGRVGDARRVLESLLADQAIVARHRESNAASDAPGNLPKNLSVFVGRRALRNEAREVIRRARLTTLLGPGGTGKTRLALELASEINEFRGGRWFVELAAIHDGAQISRTIAQAIGIASGTEAELEARIVERLATAPTLLVLDNCEHVLADAAARTMHLLASCPELTILATSRERLGTADEVTLSVPPLDVPGADVPDDLDALRNIESVELFVERAQASRAGFTLTPDNAAAIAGLCRLLQGIPLAIELAAARVDALEPADIARRFADRRQMLSAPSQRTKSARHETLRACFDWSHSLLTPAEQAIFSRLAVFAGGCGFESAEAVCAGGAIEPWDVLELLAKLLKKSLIEHDVERSRTLLTARYRMLETVRAFALEKLEARGELAEREALHRQSFTALAEETAPRLEGAEQSHYFARLEADHDNFRAALRSSLASGDDCAARLVAALWKFWYLRGHWQEGRAWCRLVLAKTGGERDARTRAKVLNCAGILATHQGDFVEARAQLTEALALSREHADAQRIAAALNGIAHVHLLTSDFAAATACYTESLELLRPLGQHAAVATTLSLAANAALMAGRYAAARPLFEECLALAQALENDYLTAGTLHNLGQVLVQLGEASAATTHFERAIVLHRKLGNRSWLAKTLAELGVLAQARGDFAMTRARFSESLRLRQDLGEKAGISESLVAFSSLAATLGEWRRAARLVGAVEQLCPATPLAVSSWQDRLDETRRRLLASGEQPAIRSALAEGRALSMAEAVTLALEA
ncbi:MAG: protein kinase domain-containing protein [Planctomycetota bacterium]